MSEIIKYLKQLTEGEDLSIEDSKRSFQIMLSGGATPPQIAAFLIALKIKGETVDEITGAALVMRHKADKIKSPPGAIDTCGTGGDDAGTLNVSSASALVLAGCGVPVAKHGNRAISSRCGSADVLEALGVKIDAPKELVEESLEKANICFLLATKHHKAMRHISPVRHELGIRTVFNLLGPLSNPAIPESQIIGVYEREAVGKMAEVLRNLGCSAAWVVHGEGGLDELSISGPSHVAELKNSLVANFTVTPADAGLETSPLAELAGGDAAHNARAMRDLLGGKKGAYRDIVLLNAAAALIVTGKAENLADGVGLAAKSIDGGKARKALEKLVEITNSGELSGTDD